MTATRSKAKKSLNKFLEKEKPKPKPELKPIVYDLKEKRKKLNQPGYENIEIRDYVYKNANRSINEINTIVQNIATKLKAQGLDFKLNTSIMTPISSKSGKEYEWRSGRVTEGGHQIQMWNPNFGTNDGTTHDNVTKWYDNGKGIVNTFSIFVQTIDAAGGADDDNNDCLYNSLYALLKTTLTNKWDHAWKLKKSLNIGRQDKVNAHDHIDMVERILNIGIHIDGDITRAPKIDTKTSVEITLQDGHYTPKKTAKTYSYFAEKKPCFYTLDKTTLMYSYYDGSTLQTAPKEEFLPRLQYKVKTDNFYIACSRSKDLKVEYNDYVYNADNILNITKGKINLYKTQTIVKTAIKLFYDLNQHVHPEEISDDEAEFILNCYRGGIMYAKKYNGVCSKGDVCSMYPSILNSNIMLPVKKGEFKTISTADLLNTRNKKGEVYFKAGIYRAKIETTKKEGLIFRFNALHHYTHTDVSLAHKLGFDITMICDDEPNFLHYSTDAMVSSKTMFKNYIDYLFPLKKQYPKLSFFKAILNTIWGALSENKIHTTHVFKRDEQITLEADETIESITKYSEDTYKIETRHVGQWFMTNYARFSPFITAQGRNLIANLALNHVKDLDNIVHMHTDSITVKDEILDLKSKAECELGDFGLEYKGMINVNNVMSYQYLDLPQ